MPNPKAHEVKFLTTVFEIRNAIRRGDWNNHDRFYTTCSALEVAVDEIDRLRAENERLAGWVSDLQAGMYVNCVYCGHRYGPGETTPVSMADALKAHVEQCAGHPMNALRAEVDKWVGHYADLLITGLEIESAHSDLRKAVDSYIAAALNSEPAQ